MSDAMSKAADYGYIGLFNIGKAWKREVKGMVGSKVDDENYIRAFNCTGEVYYGEYPALKEVRAIIRLKPNQAMLMKLRHGGSDIAWVRDDPNGDIWGWLTIFNKRNDRDMKSVAHDIIGRLLADNGPAMAVEKLERYANRLPDDWRRAFVLNYCGWYDPARADEPLHANAYFVVDPQEPDWQELPETRGSRVARDFWIRAHRQSWFRQRYGLTL